MSDTREATYDNIGRVLKWCGVCHNFTWQIVLHYDEYGRAEGFACEKGHLNRSWIWRKVYHPTQTLADMRHDYAAMISGFHYHGKD